LRMSGRMSWSEYRDVHGVTEAEDPAAFAAYLHYLSGGEWDGAAQPVEPDPSTEQEC